MRRREPHRTRSRRKPEAVLAGALGLVLSLSACRKEPPPPPSPLALDVAGCAAVRANGICEILPKERSIRAVLKERPEGLEAQLDGRPIEITQKEGAGYYRLEITLPEERAAPAATSSLAIFTGKEGARRKFTLAIEGAQTDERIEAARSLAAQGKLKEARETLGDPATYGPAFRGRALARAARIDLAAGDVATAILGLEKACDENLAQGRVSDAALDAFALSHTLLSNGRPLSAARRALEKAQPAISSWPEGHVHVGYYEALIARDAGDIRGALRRLTEVEEAASRLSLGSMWRSAVQVRAKLLEALGRPAEARSALETVAKQLPSDVPACERARLDTTIVWVELRMALASREKPAPASLEAMRARLLALSEVYQGACPRPADLQNAQLNLAIVALLAGDRAGAATHLQEAYKAHASPLASVSAWMLELRGRLLVAEGRAKQAVVPFEELSSRAIAAGDVETTWRAQLHLGQALLSAGDRKGAILSLKEAEKTLERWSAAVPLAAGRALFLGDRDASARLLVQALLADKKPALALEAARLARMRALAHEARLDRVATLPEGSRAQWEAAVQRYEQARRAIDTAAANDWKLAKNKLEEALAERRSLLDQAERALDDALSELSRAQAAVSRPLPPSSGSLLLSVFETETGYVLFAHDGRDVAVHPLASPSGLSPEALAAALFDDVAPALEAASRVVYLGYGAWQSVDVHALPFRGMPLGLRMPVAYGLDIGETEKHRPRGAAVVVANPTEDLPLSAREGERVAALLSKGRKVTTLAGAEASKAAVLSALRGAEVFHFAGHGVFAGDALSGSGLILAGARLVTGDVLAMGAAPKVVVLSGCETGRAPERQGVDVSLSYAFLASGAEVVVAASRPLADALGAAMSAALYEGAEAADWEPTLALRRAQELVYKTDPKADWASYRAFVR